MILKPKTMKINYKLCVFCTYDKIIKEKLHMPEYYFVIVI